MHHAITISLAFATLLAGSACAGPQDPLERGIDGAIRTTAGANWSIQDGVLIPERGRDMTFVMTKATYSDVEIALEFNPDAGTNSGVFVRCQDAEDISPVTCYEFNIWDAHPDQESRTGAIVTRSPPVAKVDTESKWNTMRVRAEGARLQVWINGAMTNDIENDDLDEGFIAFQYGGDNGMVKFRNIRITELP
jgi:hypothetical protein